MNYSDYYYYYYYSRNLIIFASLLVPIQLTSPKTSRQQSNNNKNQCNFNIIEKKNFKASYLMIFFGDEISEFIILDELIYFRHTDH